MRFKRFIIRLFFTKHERVHIWQSMEGRINKLCQLKIEQKYWDTYYYDDDIQEMIRLQNYFYVDGKEYNEYEK